MPLPSTSRSRNTGAPTAPDEESPATSSTRLCIVARGQDELVRGLRAILGDSVQILENRRRTGALLPRDARGDGVAMRPARRGWRRSRSAPLGLALLLGILVWVGLAAAEDAPPPPPAPPLERLFEPVREAMKPLPPFLRDTDLKIHFRSYYFNRESPSGTENEAWAFGGWLGYRSGWLLDTFGIGATF
jgi:hypothetical protein